ncbi:DUF3048 domain-containing protein [Nocardioides sp. ChNu-153]|uniref:DUF3048 domain-containing protein n=1 Tax=unclassified Nocardioides TaxID=2615069 RepID=UPI002405A0EB|nr:MULTISPECIES: DUF3048 domain-containing protein [unclassified Nocardioides]MDF9714719.1 DUF3048 domain-containing protein [Nocardioides sp. ChNu-99]MDN7120153.1 DUF3048 domain-containing protein [Nocardioides sp. ChNu-153]
MTGTARARARRTIGGVGALALALAVAACSGDAGDVAAQGDDPAPAAAPEPPPTWPFTGLPADPSATTGPAFVVKIDNTAASAPQRGLGSADLVVEELVEGGTTRLAAFFHTELPDEVGPVRSMRASDIGIVPTDDTTVVTSGAAQRTITRLRDAGVGFVEEEGAPAGFSRSDARRIPYNLFADLTEVVGTPSDGERPDDYLAWGDGAAWAGGAPATEVDVRFSGSHTTSWELDGDAYAVVDGNAGEGDDFRADTVVALEVDVVDAGYLDPAGNPVPESVLEGTGTATVFHAGRAVEATWSKASAAAPLRLLGADGAELAVPAGHTWIELVPATEGSVTYD